MAGEAISREPIQPARYTCYRVAGPIVVDGRLDEPSWRMAPKSAPFVDIVTGEPAWFDTRVALLWDDDHLYFGFWAQETDVWGTLTGRDSKIWEENDVEVFIGGGNAYYEFEINALNTVYEAFWIWKDILKPGSPYYGRPGLRTAVHVDGTVNRRDRQDRGWTVELAFPWRGLADLADGRLLPPRDGDVWRIDCSRFEKIGRNREVLDPCAGWSWNRHGHYDSHIPEVFPYVEFSSKSVAEIE